MKGDVAYRCELALHMITLTHKWGIRDKLCPDTTPHNTSNIQHRVTSILYVVDSTIMVNLHFIYMILHLRECN